MSRSQEKRKRRPSRAAWILGALVLLLLITALILLLPRPGAEDDLLPALSKEDRRKAGGLEPLEQRKKNAAYVLSSALPVPFGDAVADSYFDDALFIGDSLTNGLELFGNLKNADYFCVTSATVYGTLQSDALAARLQSRSYGKIYFLLGINEMGSDPEPWSENYAALIRKARAAQPDAAIYVQTIFPVIAEKTWSASVFSKENIARANQALCRMAREEGVYLLQTHWCFADENDAMPADYTADGVHLYPSYYAIWCDYLRTHTAP